MGKLLDAALNGAGSYAGKAYFFKGASYYRYDWAKDQGDSGYPLGIDEWGFPAPFDKGIDAAVEGREGYAGKAYFFKDDKYISYDWAADKVDSGPKSILDEWGLPAGFFGGKKKVDAAINGAGQYAKYCYLFSGTLWVRYDWQDQEPAVLTKGMGDWDLPPDIAKGLDAGLSGFGPKYGNKAYFFLDGKYARYDWGADKCDLKSGDIGAWKMPLGNAGPAAQQGQPAQQGQQVTGGDPPDIVPQAWNGRTGKVWVPDGASGKLPLVVYLHGNSGVKNLWGAGRMLGDEASFKTDTDAMNIGNLAGALIADNKIKRLVVAAPSDKLEDLDPHKGTLWQSLDLDAFVKDVDAKVSAQYGVGIDFKQVAVVGWSGAGCFRKCGLHKVAGQGGQVRGQPLKLIGLADTDVEQWYAKEINDALLKAGNTTTHIYSVHKGTGGNKGGDSESYANGFGATRKLIDTVAKLKPQPLPFPVENDDQDAFEFFKDNGDTQDPPTRTAAKISESKGIPRHWPYMISAKATTEKPPRSNNHSRMPLVWSWYGLQRYFK